MYALAAAVLLMAGHLWLAHHAADSQALLPQLGMLAVQVFALLAVLRRGRYSAPLLRTPWLLLGVAVLMQVLWGATNLVAHAIGDSHGYLNALATTFSSLYVIPCVFLLARSFARNEPRGVVALDLAISCAIAGLLYLFFTRMLSGALANDPRSIQIVVAEADVVDFSLGLMALFRLAGARSFRWRFYYYAASVYLLVNAIVAWLYNRVEMAGLQWWSGSLVDIPHALLACVALRAAPAWLGAYHPRLGLARLIELFAPTILAIMLVSLGISLARVSFSVGMMTGCGAVFIYGLRVAIIHQRQLDAQRVGDLSALRLEHRAGSDPLTGIANRATLDVRLRECCEEGRQRGAYCSVLMIDIDHFKLYNDSFGHIAGDACLVRVAAALGSVVRPGSLLARYGGEEFVLLLRGTLEQEALVVAQLLADAVDGMRIAHPSCPRGWVTVSIGIATQNAQMEGDHLQVLDAADRALYSAKSLGRSRVELAASA